MANSMDFLLNLRADTRGLTEIRTGTSALVQAFDTATRAIANTADATQLSQENIQSMMQHGEQAINQMTAELQVARMELNRLAATNATPAHIEHATKRVEQLETSIAQARIAVDSYSTAAQAASQTPPVPTQVQRDVSNTVTELENARGTLDEMGNSSVHTRQQLEQMAERAAAQIEAYERDLNDARLELNRLSATNATPEDIQRAQARINELETGINQTRTSLNGFRQSANLSMQEMEQATRRSTTSLNGLRTGYTMLASAIATATAAYGARELAQTADAYVNLSAQVQMATKEHGNFAEAMAGIHRLALQTNSSLEASAGLFNRLNTVGKEMGLTQKQALDLTQTVTQAIQMGGGSAQASEAAITQFIQAMQGGVLRGEEFNSIMENGYGLAQALAKGLNRSTGELRGMAEAGELSAERVLTALSSQTESINQTYAQLPTTIGNAMQRIQTSWQILIGQMDQASGASGQVAQWLVTLADNLGIVKVWLDDVGEGFVWFGNQLKRIDAATIEALKNALSTTYGALKDLGSLVGSAFTTAFDLINSVLSALLPFNSGMETARDNTTGFTRALQGLNVAIGLIADGFAGIQIVGNLLTGLLYDLTAAFAQLKSKFTWGEVREEAIASMDAMARKAQEYYGKASQGALDFESKSKTAWNEIGKTQAQKIAEAEALSKSELDNLLANEDAAVAGKKASEEQKIEAVKKYAEAAMAANGGVLDGAIQADLMAKGFIVTLDKAKNVSVEAWDVASAAVDKQTASIDKARKAAKSLEVDLDVALNRVSDKFVENSKHVDVFVKNMSAMKLSGEDTGKAIYAAWTKWLETAKSQAEIDMAKAKLKEFEKQGVFSTKQVELGIDQIREATRKLPEDLTEAEKAMQRLGIQSQKQLRAAAQLALNDLETVQRSGEASQAELQKAYERTIQLAHASGDASIKYSANAKAASLGLQVQIDETGKASVHSADAMVDSMSRVHSATRHASSGYRELGAVAREEAKSSLEAWNDVQQAKLDAENQQRAEMSGKSRSGGSYSSYNKANVESELRSMGYSEKEAKKLANSIMSDALTADKSAMQNNMGTGNATFLNREFSDLISKGLTSSFGSKVVNDRLNELRGGGAFGMMAAPSLPSTPSTPTSTASPTKTVNHTINIGGQSYSVDVPESQSNELNSMLDKLEELSKRG